MKRLAGTGLLAASLALAHAAPAPACDSTGCLIITRGASGVLPKRGWSLDLSYRYLDQSQAMRGSEEAPFAVRPRVDIEGERLLPAYHRDLSGSDSALQFELAYGAATRTTLYFSAPLFTESSHEIGHGSVVTPYDTWGFGDVVLGARQAVGLPFANGLLAFALKFPSGSTDLIDPFDQKLLDPMLQPGSGSWDLLFSGQLSRKIGKPRLDVSLSASYQANTTNDHGYEFGDEAIFTLSLARPLGRSLTLTAQVKRMHEGRGVYLDQPVPSTGADFTYLTGGLRFFAGRFSYYAVGQFPITRHVNETQLTAKAGVIAGVSRAF